MTETNIFNSITETIGKTPLVRMQNLTKNFNCDLLFKLEFFNPLGSVKDRIGVAMIEGAERRGDLKPNTHIIEPTSGNTGIGIAFTCAAKGYELTLVMPDTMSLERRTLFLLLGADVVLTPGPKGMKGAWAKALEIKDQDPENSYIPGQFTNPDNPEIHRQTTAKEIWEDTAGKVDMLVAGVATGGTITGVGQVLKEKKPTVEIIGVEPEESAILSGGEPSPHKIQGIGPGFVAPNTDVNVIDRVEKVSAEEALTMSRQVIKEEGIPVGISSGAAITGAFRQAKKPESQGKTIVVIIPSYSERYLSTALAEKEKGIAATLQTEEPLDKYLQQANMEIEKFSN